MSEQFYTIVTNVGKAKIANAIPTGTKINLTTLKVGDSNGAYYNPSESQTDVAHSVYQCNVTSVEVDEDNPNWITITSAIPSNVGGFSIREAGVFDDTGSLIAIGKYPETYKPVAADGSTKELYIKMTLEITNASSVELKIDPTVILATKKDINILTNSIASINAQLSDLTKIPGVIDDTGSANTYVITLANAPTAYAKYQMFRFIAKIANSGASTLNVNGLGAKALVKNVNVPLITGDILTGQIITAIYDGTNFQIIPDFSAKFSTKANKVQENWINTTLLNGWVTALNESPAYFKDDFGVIRVKGNIKNGNITNGNIIFTLPVGYRPTETRYFSLSNFTTSYVNVYNAQCYVDNAGNVFINNVGTNLYLSLDNISFRTT